MELDYRDLRIDVYRDASACPDVGVRVTHVPTGIVINEIEKADRVNRRAGSELKARERAIGELKKRLDA